MCGCSPVRKPFLGKFQAVGSFVHVSSISLRYIFVAGRYGALATGLDQTEDSSVRCPKMVLPELAIRLGAPKAVSELPTILLEPDTIHLRGNPFKVDRKVWMTILTRYFSFS